MELALEHFHSEQSVVQIVDWYLVHKWMLVVHRMAFSAIHPECVEYNPRRPAMIAMATTSEDAIYRPHSISKTMPAAVHSLSVETDSTSSLERYHSVELNVSRLTGISLGLRSTCASSRRSWCTWSRACIRHRGIDHSRVHGSRILIDWVFHLWRRSVAEYWFPSREKHRMVRCPRETTIARNEKSLPIDAILHDWQCFHYLFFCFHRY